MANARIESIRRLQIYDLHKEGVPMNHIAKKFEVATSTISTIIYELDLLEHELKKRKPLTDKATKILNNIARDRQPDVKFALHTESKEVKNAYLKLVNGWKN